MCTFTFWQAFFENVDQMSNYRPSIYPFNQTINRLHQTESNRTNNCTHYCCLAVVVFLFVVGSGVAYFLFLLLLHIINTVYFFPISSLLVVVFLSLFFFPFFMSRLLPPSLRSRHLCTVRVLL